MRKMKNLKRSLQRNITDDTGNHKGFDGLLHHCLYSHDGPDTDNIKG